MRGGLIKDWSIMEDVVDPTDEWYVPVFCKSHQEQGLKDFKNGGKNKLFM